MIFEPFPPYRVINRFRPTLAIWGVTLGLGVSLYLSEVPLFQKDVLRKVPVVSGLSYIYEVWVFY